MPYIIEKSQYICGVCGHISDAAMDCCSITMVQTQGATVVIPTEEEIDLMVVEDDTQAINEITGTYPLRPLTEAEKTVMKDAARRELERRGGG